MAGDIGDHERKSIRIELSDVVVVAAGVATRAIVRHELRARMDGKRWRQEQLLHSAGAGELPIEAIAALLRGILGGLELLVVLLAIGDVAEERAEEEPVRALNWRRDREFNRKLAS